MFLAFIGHFTMRARQADGRATKAVSQDTIECALIRLFSMLKRAHSKI
jgi:hypothetical protein